MDDLRLDPELEALFGRERATHTPDRDGAEAVLRRVERSILLGAGAGLAGSPSAPSTIPGHVAAKLSGAALRLAALSGAVGVIVGSGLGWGLRGAASGDGATAYTRAAASSVQPAYVESAVPDPAPTLPVSAPDTSSVPVVRAPTASPLRPPSAPLASDLAKEGEFIDAAREALAHRRPADALTAIEEHDAKYPHGRLAEERDALRVQALVLVGKTDAAHERAASFYRAYPDSIFRAAIEQALRP
jgi:hypothetical protein